MLQCEAKVPKNLRSTIETELTWNVRTLATEVSSRGRMGGVKSVVLARSCEYCLLFFIFFQTSMHRLAVKFRDQDVSILKSFPGYGLSFDSIT
jgi:hypothetical protein